MRRAVFAATCLLLIQAACTHGPERVAESRFVEPDRLYRVVEANVRGHQSFEVIVDIDHARLAAQANAPMPPAHVLIWSDPVLDAAILRQNPLAAVDLPLRVLVFEDQGTGKAAVIANRFDYVANRYALPDDAAIRERYETAIAKATTHISPDSIAEFASDHMPGDGLITLDSAYDFAATKARILAVIKAQSDTVLFGELDFTARAKAHGVALEPLHLVLFGAPGPGGQAMRAAPSLGLDAFCQKVLIWQDTRGGVHVTFNDLLALAERQQVSPAIPLRVINRRLKKTFSDTLKQ